MEIALCGIDVNRNDHFDGHQIGSMLALDTSKASSEEIVANALRQPVKFDSCQHFLHWPHYGVKWCKVHSLVQRIKSVA